MSQSSPFRAVRSAALVSRQSSPFRAVRSAAFKPRQSSPFRAVRGPPVLAALLVLDELKLLKKVLGRPYYVETRGMVTLYSASIDMAAPGQIGLFQIPVGASLVITEATFRVTAAANVATPATAQIGVTTGPIFASQELLGLVAAEDLFRFPIGGTGQTAEAGSSVYVTIDAPATGASVSQTAQIELTGYLV